MKPLAALLFAVTWVACSSSEPPKPGPSPYTTQRVGRGGVDKVDLLFAIDNSRSMGDKQALLADAIPWLLNRLVSPRCLDSNGAVLSRDAGGQCPAASVDEFPAVTDLHIGIVTSSLGGSGAEQAGGAPVCPPTEVEPVFNKYNAHNDDRGHLIDRKAPNAPNASGIEDSVSGAVPVDGSGGGFLAWLPKVDANIGKVPPNVPAIAPDPASAQSFAAGEAQLVTDFQSLVTGTQEYGCGLEAQLESWYRFLIQPDPYDAISIDPDPNGGPPKASLVGVDAALLKQRHDFLRPDSLVSIVMLTDEEDSWSDPLSVGGRGWVTRSTAFPGSPTGLMPRGTSACDSAVDPAQAGTTGPSDPNCTSCGFAGNLANGQPISGDPNCVASCGANCAGYYTSKEDNLNVRYVNDMKRRYGLEPQFPIERYAHGLQSSKVPNRDGEHASGNGAGPYLGKANCTNPLFAASLPTESSDPFALCDLPLGPRTPDLVLFTVIAGLPWQSLYDAAARAITPEPTPAQWQSLVGHDPEQYELTGIDPHMIESVAPRTAKNVGAIPYLLGGLPDTTSADATDPIHGREWDTSLSPLGLDLEYACTFDLPTPRECSDPKNPACECVGAAKGPGGPPLCAPGASGNSLQVRGKAYPSIRELRVAQKVDGSLVGSICPRQTKDPTADDYGYRPIASALVDRIGALLHGTCGPIGLPTDASGMASCQLLESFDSVGGPACDPANGLVQPGAGELLAFNRDRCSDPWVHCANPDDAAAVARQLGPVCALRQLVSADYAPSVGCEGSTVPGWCYESNVGGCVQTVAFSPGQPRRDALRVELVCKKGL